MTEFLDIVDEKGQPTGKTVSRGEAHREGIRHRTAHVWIVRRAGQTGRSERGYEILLQKRSEEKESFPGMFDTSSAGHIPAGEEPISSALRELEEELGIAAAPEDLVLIGDNEVTSVYLYSRPVDTDSLRLQESEVSEVRWFDLEDVWDEISRSRERFCVPTEGLAILRNRLLREESGGSPRTDDSFDFD